MESDPPPADEIYQQSQEGESDVGYSTSVLPEQYEPERAATDVTAAQSLEEAVVPADISSGNVVFPTGGTGEGYSTSGAESAPIEPDEGAVLDTKDGAGAQLETGDNLAAHPTEDPAGAYLLNEALAASVSDVLAAPDAEGGSVPSVEPVSSPTQDAETHGASEAFLAGSTTALLNAGRNVNSAEGAQLTQPASPATNATVPPPRGSSRGSTHSTKTASTTASRRKVAGPAIPGSIALQAPVLVSGEGKQEFASSQSMATHTIHGGAEQTEIAPDVVEVEHGSDEREVKHSERQESNPERDKKQTSSDTSGKSSHGTKVRDTLENTDGIVENQEAKKELQEPFAEQLQPPDKLRPQNQGLQDESGDYHLNEVTESGTQDKTSLGERPRAHEINNADAKTSGPTDVSQQNLQTAGFPKKMSNISEPFRPDEEPITPEAMAALSSPQKTSSDARYIKASLRLKLMGIDLPPNGIAVEPSDLAESLRLRLGLEPEEPGCTTPIILLVGDACGTDQTYLPSLQNIYCKGIARAAWHSDAVVIDDGFENGIASVPMTPLTSKIKLVGVTKASELADRRHIALGSHHSNHVIVVDAVSNSPSKDEIPTVSPLHPKVSLAKALSGEGNESAKPHIVAVVSNGEGKEQELYDIAAQGWPIIAIAGTGGIADRLGKASLSRREKNNRTNIMEEEGPSASNSAAANDNNTPLNSKQKTYSADDVVALIAKRGRCRRVPVTCNPTDLSSLIHIMCIVTLYQS